VRQSLYENRQPSNFQELLLDGNLARLFIVVHIAAHDFHLVPNEMWSGDGANRYVTKFVDAQLSCVGSALEAGSWLGNYNLAISNLRRIMEMACTPKATSVGVLIPKVNAITECKFRHLPFKVIERCVDWCHL
jgi:hypothetical protein